MYTVRLAKKIVRVRATSTIQPSRLGRAGASAPASAYRVHGNAAWDPAWGAGNELTPVEHSSVRSLHDALVLAPRASVDFHYMPGSLVPASVPEVLCFTGVG